jgi:hypothetical protein
MRFCNFCPNWRTNNFSSKLKWRKNLGCFCIYQKKVPKGQSSNMQTITQSGHPDPQIGKKHLATNEWTSNAPFEFVLNFTYVSINNAGFFF